MQNNTHTRTLLLPTYCRQGIAAVVFICILPLLADGALLNCTFLIETDGRKKF